MNVDVELLKFSPHLHLFVAAITIYMAEPVKKDSHKILRNPINPWNLVK
jgi:hypothetical protein